MAVDMTVNETSERALEEAAEHVEAAATAMRSIVAEAGERTWTARELQDETAQVGGWSSSIVSLAFWRLVDNGELVADDDLKVRFAPSS